MGFPGGSMVKNPLAKAGNVGSIPGSGRSPGEGNGNPFHILAWEISWTEEPGRIQSMVRKESDTTEQLNSKHMTYSKYSLRISLEEL